MCHAILRIAYHHDKAREVVEIEKVDDLGRRLSEIMDRTGVSKVTIFYPHTTHEEVKRWEVRNHQQQKEGSNEKINEVPVAAQQSDAFIQEVPAQYGQDTAAYETVCEGIESSYGEDSCEAKGIDSL